MPQTELLKPEFISKTASLRLVARRVVEGFISGLHRSPFKGFSSEFAEFREYIPGDELRYVDWKVFGKSDRLVIKEFQEETNLKGYILLDCSRSMSYGSQGITKFRYAQYIAASIAYFLIRQQDSVGIATFDEKLNMFVKPGSTPAHLQNIISVLEQSKPEGNTDITDIFHSLAGAIKRRGLIIILSDLYDDQQKVKKAISHFIHKKHEVILCHLFDPAELNLDFQGAVDLLDMETGERLEIVPEVIKEDYLKNLNGFINVFKEMAREGGLDYVMADTSMPFHEVLLAYLNKRQKMGT